MVIPFIAAAGLLDGSPLAAAISAWPGLAATALSPSTASGPRPCEDVHLKRFEVRQLIYSPVSWASGTAANLSPPTSAAGGTASSCGGDGHPTLA